MKDIKNMWASNASRGGENPEIPDKLYFRIGEVSRVSGVKPHVLRYWETEFPAITPKKSGSGHRLYRRKDVELILEIKRLLYEERFTIEGARKYLGQRAKRPAKAGKAPAQGELFETAAAEATTLDDIRRELREILEMLRQPAGG
jgi:DNA-binding transcriptional MerR regulator